MQLRQLEPALVVEQQIVHRPELRLRAGRFGGERRLQRVDDGHARPRRTEDVIAGADGKRKLEAHQARVGTLLLRTGSFQCGRTKWQV